MKKWFIESCPNWLFPTISNTYYALSHKEKVKIDKDKGGWLVQKGEIKLLSPTPKFLGFGMSEFENKCERVFKIEKGDTVLDVGACIGDTTTPMALKTGPTGQVIAVEPHPLNVKYLEYNMAIFKNIEIIQKAVWKEKTKIKFNVHSSPTGHSIIADKERDQSIEVQADTLDNICCHRRIDFAKIDVQGAEAQALEGGDEFLRTIRKLVRWDPEKRTYPSILDILNTYDFESVIYSPQNGVVYACRGD